jgi:hypothetical protein
LSAGVNWNTFPSNSPFILTSATLIVTAVGRPIPPWQEKIGARPRWESTSALAHFGVSVGSQWSVKLEPLRMSCNTEDREAARNRLQQQIDELTERHSKALQAAIYLGITPAEAKEHDERRQTIGSLMRQLAAVRQ